jgi:hypothetical protein
MTNLEGDWHVERLSGLLPTMIGVWKRIRGDRGQTRIGPSGPASPSGSPNGARGTPRWFTARRFAGSSTSCGPRLTAPPGSD